MNERERLSIYDIFIGVIPVTGVFAFAITVKSTFVNAFKGFDLTTQPIRYRVVEFMLGNSRHRNYISKQATYQGEKQTDCDYYYRNLHFFMFIILIILF